MKKCCETCIPCCDYCKYVVHETIEVNGRRVPLAPFGCSFHLDSYHQRLAVECKYCKDFICMNCGVKNENLD